ncbi:MAG TPA: DUF4388 domain-containing protein [Thermoanaerobaculia bacterium]
MAVEGTLELFRLPEILQLISQQRKTGILTVQGQQDIIAVSFSNGQIVAVDAISQTVEEGLAQILVGEGLMSSAEFARASAEHQAAGGRLLDLLVERGYVARPDLLQALRIQTSRQLQQLLRWEKGEFKFYSSDEASYEDGFIPIPVEEVLFQAGAKAAAPAPPAPGPRPVAVPPPAIQEAPVAPLPSPDETMSRRQGLKVVRREGTPPALGAVRPAPPAEGELAGPFRKMKVEAPPVEAGARPVAPKLFAAGLAALLAFALFTRPEALVLPFPWQEAERSALAQDQRESLYLKIDRAAKTYFLLEGRFPASLEQLRQMGLLDGSDLQDPQGNSLRYAASDESYTLQPLQGGQPIPGADAGEAISGNFLLDPEFLTVPRESTAQPLVLLD